MRLRDATDEDAGAMATILSDWCAATPYIPTLHSREDDQKFLSEMIKEQQVWVADTNGVVVGYLGMNTGWINHLYLAEPARSKGLGKRLLDKAKGASGTLSLWCFEANTGAQRFYEREGFTATDRTDGSGNEERLPDIRYDWRCAS